jgi:succinate dehydrogenase / fumarate reductase flavoprotein subunit
VQRACAAADRTGHAMLHTLYQKNVEARTQFFVEWMALDLIRDAEGDVVGVTALEMETGDLHILQAKTVLLATGGAGRIFQASTNAFINTGDGLGMAARSGIPLQDMEFWQFHPTGVAGAGVLLTEGCRGEGAILLNSNGERFMERYAPTMKDLAPRDFVSRSMDQEIKEGRGCGPNKDYIHMKLDHLGADTIHKRLPSVYEIGINFANVDVTKEPIPVVPTIHYQMGGIPTNINGQVVCRDARQPERGERPLCRGRMLLRKRARRQPPGHQLAARPAGVRPRGGQPHRPVQRQAERAQAAAGRCGRPHAGAPEPARGPRPAANTRRTWPTRSAPSCSSMRRCSASRRP